MQHRDWIGTPVPAIALSSTRASLGSGLDHINSRGSGFRYPVDGVQFDDYFLYSSPGSRLNR
ncbi:hypothetical protein ACLK2D_07700 [Escherichia coli]